MTSNPTAQYVAIPDILNQNENTLLRKFKMFHSWNITGINACDRVLLCVWRKVKKRPFGWFEHSEATQLLYPASLQVWILEHQRILCQDNNFIFEFKCCILRQTHFYSMSKGLTSSSQRGKMSSQSASHHGESNSMKILLFVPKPNLWIECILLRGRGGENSVE